MKKKLTIKDIAKMANVSVASVSYAVNGKEGISSATRQRILSVINETGFVPNGASKSLASRTTWNIALLYPAEASPFSDLFYYEVTNSFIERLTEADYNVILIPHKPEQPLKSTLRLIQRNDVDGVALLYSVPPALLEALQEKEIPYIPIDFPHSMEIGLRMDNLAAIRMALEYLTRHGHQNIAFCGSNQTPSYLISCFNDYKSVLSEHGLPILSGPVMEDISSVETGLHALGQLIQAPHPPTAILCSNDAAAIRMLQAAAASGIRVPEQLSIMGIDNILLSQYVSPQLSTVDWDKKAIGRISAGLLLKRIAGFDFEEVLFEPSGVIERSSVAAIGKAASE